MQCHAIVLDTTGTTYARQQPRYTERKNESQKKKNEKKVKQGGGELIQYFQLA